MLPGDGSDNVVDAGHECGQPPLGPAAVPDDPAVAGRKVGHDGHRQAGPKGETGGRGPQFVFEGFGEIRMDQDPNG